MAGRTAPEERSVTIGERDIPGFLDMLRYDGCTVVDWARVGDNYRITLRGNPTRLDIYAFTVERWASFGLALTEPVR
jgi:hypothetical protein